MQNLHDYENYYGFFLLVWIRKNVEYHLIDRMRVTSLLSGFMAMSPSGLLKICFCFSLLLLTGCNKYYGHYQPEDLLEAEGSYTLVEDDKNLTPEQQHMKARRQVNPNKIKGNRYTSRGTPKEEEHYRVLRVANGDKGFKEAKPQFVGSYSGVKPEKKPPPPRRKAVPVPSLSGKTVVRDFRVGQHPGKTRFVLDLTGPSGFSYDLNNDKGYLLVRLPDAEWATDEKKVFASHPLIKGYSVRKTKKGALVLIALKKTAVLKGSAALKPDGKKGHRIYFDVVES